MDVLKISEISRPTCAKFALYVFRSALSNFTDDGLVPRSLGEPNKMSLVGRLTPPREIERKLHSFVTFSFLRAKEGDVSNVLRDQRG